MPIGVQFIHSVSQHNNTRVRTWRKGKRPLASMPTRYWTLGRVDVMAWMYAYGDTHACGVCVCG